MSRSYRRTPILKDGGRSSKSAKQSSSRAWRRHDKMMIEKGREDDCWFNKNQAKCSWDVNDSICRETLESALEWFRERGPTSYFGETEEEAEICWRKWYYWK